ncbi:uncharacterized protein LOC111270348 [Varroa jacobsoni]|uniref:uncharacterized protein LOC111270348 n=1 Tax=Varroa jacobsoni TaxID=62625 RepID=UPI000BF54646|nr:uncharacterized protein LOC111270348 [Varroa jacobsoni]
METVPGKVCQATNHRKWKMASKCNLAVSLRDLEEQGSARILKLNQILAIIARTSTMTTIFSFWYEIQPSKISASKIATARSPIRTTTSKMTSSHLALTSSLKSLLPLGLLLS